MKALILIDCQNDFLTGALGSPEAEKIIPEICKLIKNRAYQDTILFLTQDTHYEDDYLETQEGSFLPVKHCIDETDGWEIDYDIMKAIKSVAKQYYTITSVRKETFGSLDLVKLLIDLEKREGLDEITVCGVVTDICVMNNIALLKTYFPETPITVIERCCAGSTEAKHIAALEVMESLQVWIK